MKTMWKSARLAAVLLGLGAPASAQQTVFTNNANGNWSDTSKWVGGNKPVNGGSSSYTIFSTPNIATNNIGTPENNGFQLNALVFTNRGNTGNSYKLYGTNLVFMSDGGTLPLLANNSALYCYIYAPIVLSSDLSLTNRQYGTHLCSNVSGNGSITLKNGPLWMEGSNSYSGGTFLQSGGITVSDSNGLGSGLVQVSGKIDGFTVGPGLTVTNTLLLSLGPNGSGVYSGGNNSTWAGGIILTNDGVGTYLRIKVGAGEVHTISGVICGDIGTQQFMNNYSSDGGTLVLSNTNTFTASAFSYQKGGTLQLGINNALPKAIPVNLNSALAAFNLDGYSQTISGVYGAGMITNGSVNLSVLTLSNVVNRTLSGPIGGNISFVMRGGTQTLSATNSYLGRTVVSGGMLTTKNAKALPEVTSLYLYTGGTNKLDFVGTNVIKELFINDLQQRSGVYSTNLISMAGFLSGAGYLEVPKTLMGTVIRIF